MGALSHDQFAQKTNTGGGASRLLFTRQEPKAKRGDYAVGLPGHELKYSRPVTRNLVIAHRKAMMADPAFRSDHAVMQGGWEHEGSHYLDSSKLVQGRQAAQAQGRAGAQIAAYDMHNDRDVYTKQGPAREAAKAAEAAKGVPHKIRGSHAVGFTVHPR
jgi:hypothetical protein